jgi:hypothetical protein
MLTRQEEEAERIETMRNDALVREQQKQREAEQRAKEQFGTYMSHAQAQAGELSGGRFGAVGVPYVTGSAICTANPRVAEFIALERPASAAGSRTAARPRQSRSRRLGWSLPCISRN